MARGASVALRLELLRLVRDPVALFFIVVLPVVIMLIIGATFGGQASQVVVGVVDLDRSSESEQLVERLDDSAALQVEEYTDEAALRQDVRIQGITGGVSIPAGYGAALREGGTGEVLVLVDTKQGSSTALMSVLGNVVDGEAQALGAARVASEVSPDLQEDPDEVLERVRVLQAQIQPVEVEVRTTGRASLGSENQYDYTAPSNLVLFVFINSVTGAAALVESRQLGVTRRMLAAPIGVGTILLGAAATRMVIALAQSVLILAVGSLVFGVRWGDPVAALALVLSFALLSTGAGLLIAAIVRKPDQVAAVGIPVSIGFAMLGGCMWPLEVVPTGLRTLGHLTPHAWAMDAWISLSFEDGRLGDIAGELAMLSAMAAALLVLSVWALRRSLVR